MTELATRYALAYLLAGVAVGGLLHAFILDREYSTGLADASRPMPDRVGRPGVIGTAALWAVGVLLWPLGVLWLCIHRFFPEIETVGDELDYEHERRAGG